MRMGFVALGLIMTCLGPVLTCPVLPCPVLECPAIGGGACLGQADMDSLSAGTRYSRRCSFHTSSVPRFV